MYILPVLLAWCVFSQKISKISMFCASRSWRRKASAETVSVSQKTKWDPRKTGKFSRNHLEFHRVYLEESNNVFYLPSQVKRVNSALKSVHGALNHMYQVYFFPGGVGLGHWVLVALFVCGWCDKRNKRSTLCQTNGKQNKKTIPGIISYQFPDFVSFLLFYFLFLSECVRVKSTLHIHVGWREGS